MANWTQFNYVAYLGKNTPQSVIDTLRDAHINYHANVETPPIFLGNGFDFLQEFGVTHFDKVVRPLGYIHFIVLYGCYKYQDYDEEFIEFVKWIDPYVISDYRGYLHYEDGDHLPRLIHRSKLITLEEAVNDKDEMYY